LANDLVEASDRRCARGDRVGALEKGCWQDRVEGYRSYRDRHKAGIGAAGGKRAFRHGAAIACRQATKEFDSRGLHRPPRVVSGKPCVAEQIVDGTDGADLGIRKAIGARDDFSTSMPRILHRRKAGGKGVSRGVEQ
jgi:hypothetical protein